MKKLTISEARDLARKISNEQEAARKAYLESEAERSLAVECSEWVDALAKSWDRTEGELRDKAKHQANLSTRAFYISQADLIKMLRAEMVSASNDQAQPAP